MKTLWPKVAITCVSDSEERVSVLELKGTINLCWYDRVCGKSAAIQKKFDYRTRVISFCLTEP